MGQVIIMPYALYLHNFIYLFFVLVRINICIFPPFLWTISRAPDWVLDVNKITFVAVDWLMVFLNAF